MRARRSVVVTWVGVAMLAALSTGCNSPWRTFQAVQVGRSLPALDPAKGDTAETRSKYGLVHASHVAWPVPLFAFAGRCSALTGTDGSVGAKSYCEFSWGHWVLFITGTCRYVLETDVPPEFFHPVPDDWDGQPQMAVVSMAASMLALSNAGEPEESRRALPLDDVMAKVASGAASGVEAASQPARAPATQQAPPIRCVADWLVLEKTLLEILPDRRGGQVAAALSFLRTMMGLVAFSEVLEDRSALAALTRPGSDVRGKTSGGQTYRVRNLGGRRVRVEVEQYIIRDPLLPLLGVTY